MVIVFFLVPSWLSTDALWIYSLYFSVAVVAGLVSVGLVPSIGSLDLCLMIEMDASLEWYCPENLIVVGPGFNRG